MPTALVVDDNFTNRVLASRLLGRFGWEVGVAADGAEALESLRAHPVDVVLLDISMPGLSGDEVCTRIRNEPGLANKVIAYTAHAMPDEQSHYLASGFDAVLLKPISRATLVQIMLTVGFALA